MYVYDFVHSITLAYTCTLISAAACICAAFPASYVVLTFYVLTMMLARVKEGNWQGNSLTSIAKATLSL